MATLLPRQSIILCVVLKQIGILLFDYLVSKQRSIRLIPRQSIILCVVLKQIGILLFDYLVSKQRSIRLIFCPIIIIAFDYKPNYYQP